MESFRKLKLLPRDVRTISEETLAWSQPDDPSPPWLKGLLNGIDMGWNQKLDRSGIFNLNEKNRYKLWTAMRERSISAVITARRYSPKVMSTDGQ